MSPQRRLSDLPIEEKASRSSSFGRAATHYERYRPGPPAEAVDWLLARPVETVVDLGAGTGALTRLLVDRVGQVIAVEPDERMRQVLSAEVPDASVVDGRGEALPLPDDAADAVLASSSWHWVDPLLGLPEVGRVLRRGGFLGTMWSGPDLDSPFIAQAQALLAGVSEGATGSKGAAGTLQAISDIAPESLRIPEWMPFCEPEMQTFRWDIALTADDLVGLLGTFSWVLLLAEQERDELFATARRLLGGALGVEGDVTVDVGFRCDTFRTWLRD